MTTVLCRLFPLRLLSVCRSRARAAALLAILALPLPLALVLAACRDTPTPPPAGACVAVVATNDMHGAIEPTETEVKGAKVSGGGLLVLGSYLKRLRAAHDGNILLLDAGDIYQGTLTSNLSEGRAMIDAMNALGYDAATVGNHEFDYGPGLDVTLAPPPAGARPTSDVPDHFKVVRERFAQARFPFVAANMLETSTHAPPAWQNFAASTIVEKNGLKIGIIGVASPETPRVTRPQFVEGLEFVDPLEPVAKAATSLRASGAKLIVLLAHIGGGCSSLKDPRDLSSCERDRDLFTLLSRLPAGTVDVAVGGHTHEYIAHWVNGAVALQGGARARSLSYVEACTRPEGGIDAERTRVFAPVDACLTVWSDGTCKKRSEATAVQTATYLGQPMSIDTDLATILNRYTDQVREKANRPLGIKLAKPLVRETATGDAPLGMALCEAMRQTTGAPIAIQNRGGIRTDLPAGDLSYGQLFEAIPFDNRVAVLELTGDELTAMVRYLWERPSKPLILGLTRTETKDGALTLKLADGTSIEPTRLYKVATNDYLAAGGEGIYHVLKNVPKERVRTLEVELRDALMGYLRQKF